MWQREQSYCYLRQYIRAKNVAPWVTDMRGPEERARSALQHIGGMAGDWSDLYTSECTYYYPQKVKE
jgi:hypothetical protein